jgi:hypothetical protein
MRSLSTQYVRSSKVRKAVNRMGRRVSKSFIHALDVFVERKIEAACRAHNGGKKTLDSEIAVYVGIR